MYAFFYHPKCPKYGPQWKLNNNALLLMLMLLLLVTGNAIATDTDTTTTTTPENSLCQWPLQVFKSLSIWPVNLKRDKEREFLTKETFHSQLIVQRGELISESVDVIVEIAFYSRAINTMTEWIHDSIAGTDITGTWRTLVSMAYARNR